MRVCGELQFDTGAGQVATTKAPYLTTKGATFKDVAVKAIVFWTDNQNRHNS